MKLTPGKKQDNKKHTIEHRLRQITRLTSQRARDVFLNHIMIIEASLILLAFIGAIWVLVSLLFVDAAPQMTSEQQRGELVSTTIDTLELWVEQRNQELESPITITPGKFFFQHIEGTN
ncbi:MAG: hypothetical protein ACRD4B_10935 [Acidobacteriota bacterium]